MHKCTYCGKTQCKNGPPTVHALDLEGGNIVRVQFVCEAMAEQLGQLVVRLHPPPLPCSFAGYRSQKKNGRSPDRPPFAC